VNGRASWLTLAATVCVVVLVIYLLLYGGVR
jgi:hypothetical protein